MNNVTFMNNNNRRITSSSSTHRYRIHRAVSFFSFIYSAFVTVQYTGYSAGGTWSFLLLFKPFNRFNTIGKLLQSYCFLCRHVGDVRVRHCTRMSCFSRFVQYIHSLCIITFDSSHSSLFENIRSMTTYNFININEHFVSSDFQP